MIKNRCICSLLCVFMCVYGCCCVHLAHLLPVCDDCTGHSPEPRTATSSWGGARRLEAPAGGSGWETYPSKLERWYRRAEPLNALSLQLSLCFNHQLCRWVDMQWASLTPKRKTSHFNTAYQNIDLFCVTSFSLSYCRTLYLGKKSNPVAGRVLSQGSRLVCSAAVWANNVTRWRTPFVFLSVLFSWSKSPKRNNV